ncbi:hypothetical protein DICVIV_02942 [Dictyocaulus viviparus]|uniref:LSM domain protein n=1 Tax=Dictyocaulus viviparus TaxID=29172 RepID=A0A0D8Y203_DICVI|nr:hypothetical protein DICVIV_02942 [Dictyocaulus viviparus]
MRFLDEYSLERRYIHLQELFCNVLCMLKIQILAYFKIGSVEGEISFFPIFQAQSLFISCFLLLFIFTLLIHLQARIFSKEICAVYFNLIALGFSQCIKRFLHQFMTCDDGDKFFKMPEVYIRGSTVKYLRIPETVVDLVKNEVNEVRRQQKDQQRARKQSGIGGRGGSARGRGGYRGRGK